MNAISGPPFRIPDLTIPEETVSDQLDAAARAFPDRVAVDFMRDTRTFAQLERDVARAARALLDVGVRRGDRVAIAMPNCTTHLVVFYAVLRLGAIVVEHNPTYTADQLRHQLSDSGAQVAVVWEPAAQAAMDARTGTSLRAVIAVDLTRDLPRSSRAALRLPVRAAREGRRAMRAPCLRAPCVGTDCSPTAPCRTVTRAPRRGTSRCCSTPAGPRARPRAPCSPTATS